MINSNSVRKVLAATGINSMKGVLKKDMKFILCDCNECN